MRSRSYALAGAFAVTTSELLRRLHDLAGGPGRRDLSTMTQHQRAVLGAAAHGYSAAAACSALTARLLLHERELVGAEVPGVAPPTRIELGVTALEGLDHMSWRVTTRVALAAHAEIETARGAWTQWGGPDSVEVQGLLATMTAYAENVLDLLDRTEPVDLPAVDLLSPGSNAADRPPLLPADDPAPPAAPEGLAGSTTDRHTTPPPGPVRGAVADDQAPDRPSDPATLSNPGAPPMPGLTAASAHPAPYPQGSSLRP